MGSVLGRSNAASRLALEVAMMQSYSNANVNLEQQIGEKPMGMMSEFRTFAMRGNVIDLAVGVIIGAAFGKIVDSVVNDLIMPVVGRVVGKLDFSNMFIALACLLYTSDAADDLLTV